MRDRQPNQVALSIGVPGDNATLHLPDLQRGLAVVGAPGSGKTFSVIDPAVVSTLLQGFPLILYDFKYPGQATSLAPLAQHLGYDVHVFAPGFAESEVCNLLDFMADAEDATMARELAKVMARNTQQASHSRTDEGFFAEAGEQLIVATVTAAKASDHPDLAMMQAILRLPNLAARVEHTAHLSLWNRILFDQLTAVAESERTVASIIGTATEYFSRFMTPTLLGAFTVTTTLPLDLHRRQMIVVGLDKERRAAVSPLVATTLHLLITRNMARPRKVPLVVSLDELPTLYLPNLVNWINEHREQGLTLMLGFQNLAQLEKTYGLPTARAIFGACATKALFNPGEPESAQRFAQYLGEEEVRFKETARSRSGDRTTINRSEQRRTKPLFEAGQFLKLPTGKTILISPGFGNRCEAALPIQHQVRVSTTVQQMLARSSRAWERLRPLLIQRSGQQPLSETALKQRLAHAETLLPPPAQGAG